MTVGHVGADDEEDVRLLEVLVRTGRAVGAEGELVAAARAGHAQPGVGLDLVGADETLGEFVGQVLGFQAHLPGDVERDGVGPVLVDDRPQPQGRAGDRFVEAGGDRLAAALGTHQCGGKAPRGGEHVGRRRALGAQPAEVGGVGLVARRLEDLAAAVGAGGDVEEHAAAHTAVRADRPYLGDGRRRVLWGQRMTSLLIDACPDGTKRPLRRCDSGRSWTVTLVTHPPHRRCENE